MAGKKREALPSDSVVPLAGPLGEAASKSPGGVKPEAFSDQSKAKKNYAQNLSQALATMFAQCLGPAFPRARVTPAPDGSKQEFTVGGVVDRKKTDVGVWDSSAGLILGLSIKTLSFRDFSGTTKTKAAHLGRYQKNVKRNDMELRDEADVLHRRQPYAVLVGILFTPIDSTWDGVSGHSSFAHMVLTFRKRVGRLTPDSLRSDLFEMFYIGLYDEESGAVNFFDVRAAPPRNQTPTADNLIDLRELISRVLEEVERRNRGGQRVDELYAQDDPLWVRPDLPPSFVEDEPATLESALAAAEPDDGDDDLFV